MAHGKFVMTGATFINVGGTAMSLTQSGYPEADVSFVNVAGLATGDYMITYTPTTLTVQLASLPFFNCSVVYTEAPLGVSPTFVLNTSGC